MGGLPAGWLTRGRGRGEFGWENREGSGGSACQGSWGEAGEGLE